MRLFPRNDDTAPQVRLDAYDDVEPVAPADAPRPSDVQAAPDASPAPWAAFDPMPANSAPAPHVAPSASLLPPARRPAAVYAPPLQPPAAPTPTAEAAGVEAEVAQILADAGVPPARWNEPATASDDATLSRLYQALDEACDDGDDASDDDDGNEDGGRGERRALAWADADAVRLQGVGAGDFVLGPQPWSQAAQAQFFATLWQEGATVAVALADPAWLTEGGRVVAGAYALSAGDARPVPGTPAGPGRAMRVDCTLTHGEQTRALAVLRVRWPDFAALPPEALALTLNEIEGARGAGVVVVHCTAGRGRSGTLTLAAALRQQRVAGASPTLAQLARTFVLLRAQRAGAVETPQQFVAAVRAAA